MRRISTLLCSALIVILSFQNCSQGDQQFDARPGTTNAPSNSCVSESSTIRVIANADGQVTVELAARDVTRSEWVVTGQAMQTTNSRRFSFSHPRGGPVSVSAIGFTSGCEFQEKYTASLEVDVVPQPGADLCTNVVRPSLTANPISAVVGGNSLISIGNESLFRRDSIRWKVNQSDRANANGAISLSLSGDDVNAVRTLSIQVTADQICGSSSTTRTSAILDLPVTAAPGQAALTSFDVPTKTPSTSTQPNPVRGAGLEAVYKVARSSAIQVTLVASNLTASNGIPAPAGMATCAGANCFVLRAANTSTLCEAEQKTFTLNSANGDTVASRFFYYCAAGLPYCLVGRDESTSGASPHPIREAGEICSTTTYNESLSATPNPCIIAAGASTCATRITASGLNPTLNYGIFVVDGALEGGSPMSCGSGASFSTGVIGSSDNDIVSWITATGVKFRLRKGLPGQACGALTPSGNPQVGAELSVYGQAAIVNPPPPPVQQCRTINVLALVSNNFNPASFSVSLTAGERIKAVSVLRPISNTQCVVGGMVNQVRTTNYGIRNDAANLGRVIVDGGCGADFQIQICTLVPAAEVRNDTLCGYRTDQPICTN